MKTFQLMYFLLKLFVLILFYWVKPHMKQEGFPRNL